MKLCIFDSGIGGLNVLEEVRKLIPNENIIYYQDSSNNPYGEKTDEELWEIVNPVFNTAKSCVQLDAAAGDEDSKQLLGTLGFEPFGSQTTKSERSQRGTSRNSKRNSSTSTWT